MNAKPCREVGSGPLRLASAFTLLEVMIAMGLFFMAIFSILALVSQSLRMARGLSMGEVDFGTVAAEIARTNRLDEGMWSGDFGDYYPGASWTAEVFRYMTEEGAGNLSFDRGSSALNSSKLYQADIVISWPQNGMVQERKTSILLFRPDSTIRPGAGGGGGRR